MFGHQVSIVKLSKWAYYICLWAEKRGMAIVPSISLLLQCGSRTSHQEASNTWDRMESDSESDHTCGSFLDLCINKCKNCIVIISHSCSLKQFVKMYILWLIDTRQNCDWLMILNTFWGRLKNVLLFNMHWELLVLIEFYLFQSDWHTSGSVWYMPAEATFVWAGQQGLSSAVQAMVCCLITALKKLIFYKAAIIKTWMLPLVPND